MKRPHNGSNWEWCGRNAERKSCISISNHTEGQPWFWNVCILGFISVLHLLYLLKPCFLFPASGPSDSCDGAGRRGLGHTGALFGQAWSMSLCCFWWGHFLFPPLVDPEHVRILPWLLFYISVFPFCVSICVRVHLCFLHLPPSPVCLSLHQLVI